MKRGDVVYLALTEARCTPSGYCHRKGMCARHLVKPDQGRPVADYSLQSLAYAIGWCGGFLDAAKHRDPLPGVGGPRVHEAPGGIFRG